MKYQTLILGTELTETLRLSEQWSVGVQPNGRILTEVVEGERDDRVTSNTMRELKY
jgi:hypothetical protein